MNSRRKNRLIMVVCVLVGLSLATALVMYALRSNIDLFYTPDEIINGKGATHQKPQPGQRLRVGGMVLPGSVQRDPHTLAVSFQLYDGKGMISVHYVGILPDLFREGQGIVAQGVLENATLVNAKEVLAKHDEKYTPPEIKDAMNKNQNGPTTEAGSPGS
ncbi:cytochrome c biogenesis protein CcmE [Erwinia sp. OLTSP20]|uniref:cytochrome c maturation protein CcmE n=1 Tax=unclassified Erwinia TaxID=2622719 RepID=UPI000C178709|nr:MULTISPECIES: cytochrome c maturation protein CcmE [unclassified Erwinia]PIJ51535.1 cytochrome c biogenesis protein CcmE [Erwinia sp. OAMSP11]PIJ75879.1 cytochrome c biogenesis protein CcmE [Erwinia sp. OLSSP12]PIJ83445.1 cytochrome c biogenesis protein CcmE [Erwinia sp. OLCASP19]PIJ86278.1 cytochrome c biogenesis protein CcmE [Erwinia sp. OLMTSP26]PIJ88479.1 cytochrome c biogenesis protein CcmE [Erwinia sp. OLMDSP33]